MFFMPLKFWHYSCANVVKSHLYDSGLLKSIIKRKDWSCIITNIHSFYIDFINQLG